MTSLKKDFLIENYQIDGIARGNIRIMIMVRELEC